MKRICLLPGTLALLFAACNSGAPIAGGDFDPLVAPGNGRRTTEVVERGYKAGTFVKTMMDNTAFFSKRPKGNADAEKMLKANTEMKVISDDGSYVKVELNSGEVGFVPSILVSDMNPSGAVPPPASGTLPLGSPGEYQVYPPVGGGSLPPVDSTVPVIPPQIDPEAPQPLPESTPTPTPAPLPPNTLTPPTTPETGTDPATPEKTPGE